MGRYTELYNFIPWLVSKGYVERVNIPVVHLGDYGRLEYELEPRET